jgi:hypothetical protein
MLLSTLPAQIRAQFPVFIPKNYVHAAAGAEPMYLHGAETRDALVKATTGMFYRPDQMLVRDTLKKMDDATLRTLVCRLRGEVNSFARNNGGNKPALYAREVFSELRTH